MSAISSLFLAACSEYGLAKIDTGEPAAPPEPDSAPQPTDTGEPYDTDEPPAPSGSFGPALATCFNLTENSCPIDVSTDSLEEDCLADFVDKGQLQDAAVALAEESVTFADLIAGHVPVTGYVYYLEDEVDDESWQKRGGFKLAIGDHYDELAQVDLWDETETWPVGYISCTSVSGGHTQGLYSSEEPYIGQGVTNHVFPTGDPGDIIGNQLNFFIQGFEEGLYDNDNLEDRSRMMYLNWDYVWNSDVGFTAIEDLVEGASEYNTHDLSTTENESDSTVEEIENMALSYLGGEGSRLFLYTP